MKEEPLKFNKNIHSSLTNVESFNKEKAFVVVNSKSPINNCIASVSRNTEREFICKIYIENLLPNQYKQDMESLGIEEDILLKRNDDFFLINNRTISEGTISLSSPQILSLKLTHFQLNINEKFDNKFHRLIIPIKNELQFGNFESHSLKIGTTTMACGLVQIKIDEKEFHLFKYKNSDTGKKYLFIDCINKSDFTEFKTNSNAIINAFSYMSGNLYLDEYYYVTFVELKDSEYNQVESISYEKKGKSILSNKPLLDRFEFIQYINHIDRKDIFNIITPHMTTTDFSNLCRVVKTNETYLRCCRLIIEGNECKQRLLKAGIFSIALETITNLIYEENISKIDSITDKDIAREIKNKFSIIIDEYNSNISKYGLQILKSKINDIDKPTNSKKLSKPFEIYGIELTKEDIEILSHRNKFLHGTSPYNDEELKEKEYDLIYIITRLELMINSLMLKYIGYKGHIINNPALLQINSKKEVTEPPFKLLL